MELLEYLSSLKAVKALKDCNNDIVSNDDTIESLLIASSFNAHKRKLVIVKSSLYQAQKLYDRLEGLVDSNSLLFFPSDESFRLEAIATSLELVSQRIYVMNKLLELDNYILICHTASLCRLLPSLETFKNSKIDIKVGDIISPSLLIKKLIENGYSKSSRIEHSLQFSTRGGVIDIFSVNNELPIRIEFFGDEVDSIRFFSLETSRTVEIVKEVSILSGTDLIFDSSLLDIVIQKEKNKLDINSAEFEEKCFELDSLKESPSYSTTYKYYSFLNPKYESILDYCRDAKIIYSNPKEIKDNYQLIGKETFSYSSELGLKDARFYHNIYDLFNKISNKQVIKPFVDNKNDIEFKLREVDTVLGSSKQFVELIKQFLAMKYKIVLCLDNTNQVNCIKDWCLEGALMLHALESLSLPEHNLSYTLKTFKEGFELVEEQIIYLSSLEIFGIHSRSKKNYTHYKNGVKLQSYENLEVGDYIVHEDYGIGQFMGIETLTLDNIHRDYLHIRYANDRTLDVPLEQYKSIRKYMSKEGSHPKLSKLGGKEWENTKKRIKERLADVTQRLLKLYMERTKDIGYACLPDEEYQIEFENSFPYELTSDQAKSIQEIKKDMESPYPMDRILCGDVGFGKTEVAFTAAFKAIVNGKQVALLCPTTLLARQHYEVAKARFTNFPVNIALVSRLVSNKELKEILGKLERGEIDLIIGTHKLLGNGVKFKDLGLLVVDEEQRFGVIHKEKIKELKNGIDVLTLSATPIPRTMQSALIGLRNLSQLTSAPSSRMPVQTYVLEKNDTLVKEIIERELGRNGQVFYLHNNISNIDALASRIRVMIPRCKVGIIHGKMDKEVIEDTMIDFQDGKIDVLVATTIIENGIDIPNANTILVDEADRFGLSQLYQIRGRVGRGDKLAYAYLFYNKDKQLNEIASKRLQAIKEFTALGSGYRIALRDLTIRGAGDILGEEQAGFIDSVGIDMYISLLQESIEEAKYGPKEKVNTVKKNLNVDAYIPEGFTSDDIDKIDVYKKVSEVNNITQLIDLKNELDDVFGKIPESVSLLLEKRRFEIFIQDKIIDDIVELDKYYELVLSEEFSSIDGIGIEIFEMCYEVSNDIEITYRGNKIRIKILKSDPKWLDKANTMLLKLVKLLDKYK